MKFPPHRVGNFKLLFWLSSLVLVLVGVIPDIINYFTQWLEPVPDKEGLFSWIWIVPLVSTFGAGSGALLIKTDLRANSDGR